MKRGSGFARWMKAHPATPTREGRTLLATYEVLDCPPPLAIRRMSQDQYRCHVCGIVWDVDEPRPPCQSTNAPAPKGNP